MTYRNQWVEKTEIVKVPRLRAWFRAVGGVVAFLILTKIVNRGLSTLLAPLALGSARGQTTLALSGGFLGEWLFVVMLAFYLQREGRGLGQLGLTQRGTVVGWLASGMVTALFVAGVLFGALRGGAPVLEASVFNVYNSLVAALGPGVCEEIVFRGFVMTELQRAGSARITQVLASGILFGLAHFGWGALASEVNWAAMAGAVISTTILGALYGVVYLVGRRSLWPVIAGHGLGNLIIEPWLVLAGLTGTLGPP